MKVKEIMNTRLATCSADAKISDAARIMWDHDCGIVPIIDAETKRVVGVLTDRDACMASLSQNRSIHEIPVGEAMSTELCSVDPEDPLDLVHRKMKHLRIHRVMVTDKQERLLGLVSLADMAREAVVPRSGAGENQKRDVAETMAAVEGFRSRV